MNTVIEQTASHVALYRKYRPTGFDSLIGQGHVKTTLENAITSGKVSHAYLFTGPRGTGKTSTAKLFAKAINCKNPQGINPCGNCEACSESNLDIIEMDAASNNGVDHIRDLRQDVQMAPLNSRYKVYIIDECHMLTTQAFNALLKTLEEPPKHVVFVLATTEAHKVPQTILSRCQRFDFKRISQNDIIQRLEYVVQAENVQAELPALQVISQIAAGGLRDALSILDQAISTGKGQVTLDGVLAITGAVDVRKIGTLLMYIANKQTEQALQHFNACYESGSEPRFFIEEMMIYLRDILVSVRMGEKASLKKAGTDVNFPQVVQAIEASNVFGYLNVLQDALNNLKMHHDQQLLLEMTIINMINGGENDLQRQINELKQMVMNGVQPMPNQLVNEPAPQVSATESFVTTSEPTTELTLDGVASMVTPSEPVTTTTSKPTTELTLDGVASMVTQSEPVTTTTGEPTTELTLDGIASMVTSSELATTTQNEPNTELTLDDVSTMVTQSEPVTSEAPELTLEDVGTFVTPNEPAPLVDEGGTFGDEGDGYIMPPPEDDDEPLHLDGNVTEFIDRSLSGEDWEDIAEQYTTPPVEENIVSEQPTLVVEETPSTPVGEENPSSEEKPETANILLDDKELEVLNALLTAVKEHRNLFNEKFEEISKELMAVSKSTAALFREFTVKAVSENVIVVQHDEKAKVKLLEKVKNRSMIESTVADVYKPMKLLVVTNQEWANCTAVYRATHNLK